VVCCDAEERIHIDPEEDPDRMSLVANARWLSSPNDRCRTIALD
jgi:hypothetical protein